MADELPPQWPGGHGARRDARRRPPHDAAEGERHQGGRRRRTIAHAARRSAMTEPNRPVDQPTLEVLQVGALRMRVATQGSGPLVLLCHGFPESWHSWRHQLAALAAAGYRAVAPDM